MKLQLQEQKTCRMVSGFVAKSRFIIHPFMCNFGIGVVKYRNGGAMLHVSQPQKAHLTFTFFSVVFLLGFSSWLLWLFRDRLRGSGKIPRNPVPCTNMELETSNEPSSSGPGYIIARQAGQSFLHLALTDLSLRSQLPYALRAELPLRLHRTNANTRRKENRTIKVHRNHTSPCHQTAMPSNR